MAEINYNFEFDDMSEDTIPLNSNSSNRGSSRSTELPTNNSSIRLTGRNRSNTDFTNFSGIRSVRTVEDDSDDIVYVKVSDFIESGQIRLTGRYSQNFVDVPKYDLTKINVLDDISLKFLVAIKETKTSAESVFFTSKVFYDELIKSYSEENPYFTNSVITQEKVVVITLADVKDLISDLHIRELNTFLSKEPVIVIKNLFEYSNYGTDPNFEPNPTYELSELVRYIDWVVSKPSANYNERLLDPTEIGEWTKLVYAESETVRTDDGIPGDDEPSRNNNVEGTYPPINRKGAFINELVTTRSGEEFVWTGEVWRPFDSSIG